MTTHPSYNERIESWDQLSNCFLGEKKIKDEREKYLPIVTSMYNAGMASGQPGALMYTNYIARAVFPDVIKSTVRGMVGLMHKKQVKIGLPKQLEPMRANATPNGETLVAVLRKIHEAQLLHGRIGFLVEISGSYTKHISRHNA